MQSQIRVMHTLMTVAAFFFILCVRAVIGGRMRRVCVSVCARAFERPRSKFN